MGNSQKFSYQQINQQIGAASYLPFLHITLIHNNQSLTVSGLLNTGSFVSTIRKFKKLIRNNCPIIRSPNNGNDRH